VMIVLGGLISPINRHIKNKGENLTTMCVDSKHRYVGPNN
jgi:hypothetical protein